MLFIRMLFTSQKVFSLSPFSRCSSLSLCVTPMSCSFPIRAVRSLMIINVSRSNLFNCRFLHKDLSFLSLLISGAYTFVGWIFPQFTFSVTCSIPSLKYRSSSMCCLYLYCMQICNPQYLLCLFLSSWSPIKQVRLFYWSEI